jgi:hypothetical protein
MAPPRGDDDGNGSTQRRLRAIHAAVAAPAATVEPDAESRGAIDGDDDVESAVSMSYLMSRMRLIKAMNEAPTSPNKGEFDRDVALVPAMEALGIHIAHAVVSRMLLRNQLSRNQATFLAACLGCHSYCVAHSTVHGGVAQGNPDYLAMQSTVYRLAAGMIGVDDGHQASHKRHHAFTNTPQDPDYGLSFATIDQLGLGMAMGTNMNIAKPTRGGVKEDPDAIGDWSMAQSNLVRHLGIEALRQVPAFAEYHEDLWCTTKCASSVTSMILGLMFGRYPHRNGRDGTNETDTYYENTYRGQGQVDLWMMGEGQHHLHHAKNDVNYTILSKVSDEIDEAHPEMKVLNRGTGQTETILGRLEQDLMPEHLDADSPDVQMEPWDRTVAVREAIGLLHDKGAAGCEEAVMQIAAAVIDNSIRVTTTCDAGLLRELLSLMQLPPNQHMPDVSGAGPGMVSEGFKNPLPMCTWGETLFSEENIQGIRDSAEAIRAEVAELSQRVGVAAAACVGDDGSTDMKDYHYGMHKALAATLWEDIGAQKKQVFMGAFNDVLRAAGSEATVHPDSEFPFTDRLKAHMGTPITPGDDVPAVGSFPEAATMIATLFAEPQAKPQPSYKSEAVRAYMARVGGLQL